MPNVIDLLSGVPLIESPLFDSLVRHAGWSEQEASIAQQMHTRGFAVIDFPDPEIGERIARIKQALGPCFGLEADGLPSPETITALGDARLQDAWKDNSDVRAIAANPVLRELLSKLYGRRAFPFQTLNFPVGTQQHLHSDAVHFSSLPERFMCGVWLAMEDIHPDAGKLEYLAGSHRWPILSNAMLGHRGADNRALSSAQTAYEPVWRAMIAQSGCETEHFMARKGQALIWAANLLHGGSPRTDRSLTRWSQVTHYYFENCLYYTPAYSDETTGNLALRKIVDIASGEAVPNRFLGTEVPLPRTGKRGRVARLRRAIATRLSPD